MRDLVHFRGNSSYLCRVFCFFFRYYKLRVINEKNHLLQLCAKQDDFPRIYLHQLKHGIPGNTGIPSIKIQLNIASLNHYLDSHCILTLMIPEIMIRAICCKK